MKKRKLLLGITILVIIVALGLGFKFILLNNKEKNKNTIEETTESQVELSGMTTVFWGSLESNAVGKATIDSNSADFEKVYESDYEAKDKLDINVIKGQEIKKGDILFSLNNQNIVAEEDGRIINVSNESRHISITLLAYNKLFCSMKVSYEDYLLMNYESSVTVTIDGENRNGYIKDLGLVCEDNQVEVKIGFDGYIMPGREADVQISLGKTDDMLLVPSEFITNIDGLCFCYVNYGDEYNENIVKQEVEIGRQIAYVEAGETFYYSEIISGVKDGDIIVILDN